MADDQMFHMLQSMHTDLGWFLTLNLSITAVTLLLVTGMLLYGLRLIRTDGRALAASVAHVADVAHIVAAQTRPRPDDV